MAEQSEQAKKDALIRPKPPKSPPKPEGDSKQEIPTAKSPNLSPPPSRPKTPKKPSGGKPSGGGKSVKPSRKPKKREKPPLILENENLKAGDDITLPHTGKTVKVTHFHKSPSEVWFVLFDGGSVRQDILS
ncbi:hypothetical protein PN462_02480 [Spirulina sp. CS-785/01]|uniref:hypothetical protein n=1 Tax=Spirulina sp. CS-785/01 TaxID=3021716 RepID=UPI00232D846B|nr:hypothetical protein [Spirulina sp. CS-785/01]MDB9311954.1 hypothetical protein [Spirulina sp. CS-785/01]